MMERYDDALSYYERSLAIQPDLWSALVGIVLAHACRRDYANMYAWWEKYSKTVSKAGAMVFLASMQALAGKGDEGLSTLSSAMKLDGFKTVSPGLVAWAYAALRDEDKTFEWLEKGLEQNDSMVTIINDHIVYKDLRARQRYRAILKKLNLDKYQEAITKK